jgi:hypothetical protein
MNAKTTWGCICALTLLILSANSTVNAQADSTNYIRFSSGTVVYSPLNVTYNTGFLTLNLTFGYGLGIKCSLSYSIDGKYLGIVPLTQLKPDEIHVVNPTSGLVKLSQLSEGSHSLTINVTAGVTSHSPNPPGAPFKPTTPGGSYYEARWSDTINFTIDLDASQEDLMAPVISEVSVENNTYSSGDFPLNFIVSKKIRQAVYTINGQEKVIVAANTTISGLQAGPKFITIYVWDQAGNCGVSKTVYFNIADQTPEPESSEAPSIETPSAAALSTIAVLTFALLLSAVALKKKCNKTTKTNNS